MANENNYYIGTDLKFAFKITAVGFDMDDDEYGIRLRCGNTSAEVEKGDIVDGDGGEHYLLVDTTQFPSGTLRLIVTANVPDEDFESGVRREVAAMDLCAIKHP